MSELSRSRFESLAEAFGGDVARWPAPEREAAARLMAADPDFARAVLTPASRLDAVLDDRRGAGRGLPLRGHGRRAAVVIGARQR